ncbi:MAG: aminopeptidase, partial [Actinomycetota bacterium]|nr:aminopeptidase [Actinomycetota bacterium]
FYYGPIHDGTNGVVAFSEFPAYYIGTEVQGARLEFRDGKVVDASAQSGEDFLLQILDSDEGARTLGEMGIGCNHRITRHMKNTLYDEKIDGTVHFALGAGLPETGATNESAVHWDMVKDLRSGGRIICDGEVVQEDGRWLF